MNAISKKLSPAAPGVSVPSAAPARRRAPTAPTAPANAAMAGVPSMERIMDPAPFPELARALDEIERALYGIEDGVDLIDIEEPKSLDFIVDGLRARIEKAKEQMSLATKAKHAMRPRLSDEAATFALVQHLVQEKSLGVADADLPELARAYRVESDADPEATGGVILDRAMRRVKAEAHG